jgi:hypothetical protein
MPYVPIDRKRPTAWPWLAGIAVLAVAIWGATVLLAAPEDDPDTPAALVPEDTLAPSPIPMPPAPIRDMGAGRSIEELIPLSEEHAGEVVRAEGEVVATGTTGFWLVAGGYVLRVDSDRTVRRGESVAVQGVLQPADEAERTDEIASEVLARDPAAESWEVVRTMKLVESGEQ